MKELMLSRQWLIRVFVLLCVCLTSIIWYSDHIQFIYRARQLGFANLVAVPIRPAALSPIPDNWRRWDLNELALSLPPQFVIDPEQSNDAIGRFVFKAESCSVVVNPTTDSNEYSSYLSTAMKLRPDNNDLVDTIPNLRLACYQVKRDDFRWSMTPKEVRWLSFCLTSRIIMRSRSSGYIETFCLDFDATLDFGGNGRAVFEWQQQDRLGQISFADRNESLGTAWIGTVCRSVTLKKEH